MAQEYGTPIVDFIVQENNDPRFLVVQDITQYFHAKRKPAIIEICPPGSDRPVTHYIVKNAPNVFNSTNMDMNCATCEDNYLELPDGIYKITVKISPDTFQKTKYYLKIDKLKVDLGKIMIKLGLDYNPKDASFIEWFTEVYMYMIAATGAITDGDLQSAKKFYDTARKLVDKLSECKNCY